MQNFKDKVIWITGASSGIGREMARQCNALGAYVVLSSRNEEALNQLKSELSDSDKAMVLPLDMAYSDNFSQKAELVTREFGKIDLLFIGAGVSQRSEVHETPIDVDRKIMEVNFFGAVALTKAVLPVMRKQKEGQFVVISSIAGKTGFFERSAYSASKHALHGFFESLRLEEHDNNISVTIVCPGPAKTNMSLNAVDKSGNARGIMDKMQEEGMTPEYLVKQIIRHIPRKKLEVFISKGPESFGMKLKALFPRVYYNLVRKRESRG